MDGLKLIEAVDLRELSDGIYYSGCLTPVVDAGIIAFLKNAASTSPLRRARFCAHPSPDAKQHDMLIVSRQDTYVAPHRHMSKSETFFVIEGSADVIFFNETGRVNEIVKMGAPTSGRAFFYRMPPQKFHSLFIESEFLVFLESTTGPFDPSDREYASWAPEYKDLEGGEKYIRSIVRGAASP